VTKPDQPRPLTEAEKLARRKRIVRVAKRQGLVDVDPAVDDAPVTDDDDTTFDPR
jgi:hypothetical protein